MVADPNPCYFCDRSLNQVREKHENHSFFCDCPNCGKYWLSFDAVTFLQAQIKADRVKEKLYLISGYIRELQEYGAESPMVTVENYKEFIDLAQPPKTLQEKLDRILLYVYRKSTDLYDEILVPVDEPAIVYARSTQELENWLRACVDTQVLELPYAGDNYVVTLLGITRAEQLEQKGANTQCFVAMRFSDDMRSAFLNAIKPAVKEAMGLDAVRVDEREFNEDVVDQIIAEIRQSRFVIADLTGHRGGVYFEAGFAMGLGLPVIFTCRQDDFEDEKGKKKLHFDVEHYNFILWETEDQLRTRLTNRIRATILLS